MNQTLVYIVAGYVWFTVLLYFLSDSILFQSPRPTSFIDRANTLKLALPDGKKITALYLPNKEARYTILFSHGNAEDLYTLGPFLAEYHARGFSIFAYDYPGYGTSEGHATEQSTYDAIRASYDYLTKTRSIPPKQIIIHGRSLGSSVSIELATHVPCAGLILESPFLSAYRVYTRIPLFPFDKYKNLSKIAKIQIPTLVIHGMSDTIIPFSQGEKIYNALSDPKQLYAVKYAGHNDVYITAPNTYWNTIEAFVKEKIEH